MQMSKPVYKQAKEVSYQRRGNQFRPLYHHGKVGSKTLVYLESSPDYCIGSKKMGVLGTSGRSCNESSNGSDSCSNICCGREYKFVISV